MLNDTKQVGLKEDKATLTISFPYSQETVIFVKSLVNRKYSSSNKTWSAPAIKSNIVALHKEGFELSEEVQKICNEQNIPDYWCPEGREYLPFQKEGIYFLDQLEGKAIIGDEPGLGKTIQALGYLSNHPEIKKVLLVCPATLKYNWYEEAQKWLPKNEATCVILEGKKAWELNGKARIFIINYDVIYAWMEILSNFQFDVIILDEAHYIKNPKAKRTKAVKFICKKIPKIISLTGTPAINRPIELYNMIKLIAPTMFPSYFDYAKRYCAAKYTRFGWDFTGSSNEDDLHELLSKIMIRRKKEDVLLELPDKRYSYVPFPLNKNCEYSKAENNFIAWIHDTKGKDAAMRVAQAEQLTRITYLRKLAVEAVLDDSIAWIKDFLENDQKIVVFAIHKDIVDALKTEFKGKCVVIDGRTSSLDRQKAVTEFQTNNKIKVFIGNIQAAGVGITLTAASTVAFLELPWTPGELEQACDRCHRIGQKNAVNVYYLLAKDSIEESLAQLIDAKRKTLSKIIEGYELDETKTFEELFKKYA